MASKARGLRGTADRLADRLELPKDVFFDLPRIVLVGNLQVSVENHRGLLSYDGKTLVLGLQSGRLIVRGQDLVVGLVGESELTVTGRVEALHFEPGNGTPDAAPKPQPD
jgi:sporulation protein YqfC